MKRQDDLFNLIHSMSRSEKRYFRMSAAVQQGDKQYLRLFNALLKQKQYDESAILKIAGKQLSKNRLNFLKNYLYNNILNALRQLYGKTGQGQLKDLKDKAHLLYDKGLYDQSRKILSKAKKIAKESDHFLLTAELLGLEFDLLGKNNDQTEYLKNCCSLRQQQQEVLIKSEQVNESKYLFAKIRYLYTKLGHPRNEKTAGLYRETLENPIFNLLDGEASLPFKAKMYLLLSKVIYHMCRYEHAAHFSYAGQLIELYKAQEKWIVQNPENYLSALSYYLKSCSFLCYEKAFKEALDRLKTLADILPVARQNQSVQAKIFFTSCYNELFFYLQNCQIQKGLDLVPVVEEGLEEFKDQLNRTEKIYLRYSVALVHFGLAHFVVSLDGFNHILNNFKPEETPHIYLRIRLMLLINHFELNNLRLLEHLVVSTYRYLLKKRNMYQYETAVIRFLRKLSGLSTTRQLYPLFAQLLTELLEIIKDPFEFAGCAWFVFWLEGKVEGINLPEVFARKLVQKSKGLVE